MKNQLENDFIIVNFDQGIIFAEFKVVTMDLTAARECVSLRLKINEKSNYPFLADARKVQKITKEARDYLASDEGTRSITASALIIDSIVGKVLSNFFLNINKPKVPLKVFNNIQDAVAWLNQYKI